MYNRSRVSFEEDYNKTQEDSSTISNQFQSNPRQKNQLRGSNNNNENQIPSTSSSTTVKSRSRIRNNDSMLNSINNLLEPSPLITNSSQNHNWNFNKSKNLKLNEQVGFMNESKDKGKGREISSPPIEQEEESTPSTSKSKSLLELRRQIWDNLHKESQPTFSGVDESSNITSSPSPFLLLNNSNKNIGFQHQSTPPIYNPFASLKIPNPFPISTFPIQSNSTESKNDISTPSSYILPPSPFSKREERSFAPSPESIKTSPSTTASSILKSKTNSRLNSIISQTTTLPSSPSSLPPNTTHKFIPKISSPLAATTKLKIKLSTIGQLPIRHLLRSSGFIEIVSGSQELVIDLSERKGTLQWIKISSDGNLISVISSNDIDSGNHIKTYDRDSLPIELEKYYNLAYKFIQAVRGQVKKHIVFTQVPLPITKQIIYSDSPASYEITFYSTDISSRTTSSFEFINLLIRIDRQRNTITLTRPESAASKISKKNQMRKFSFSLESYISCPSNFNTSLEETGMIDWSLNRMESIDLISKELDSLLIGCEELILPELVKVVSVVRREEVRESVEVDDKGRARSTRELVELLLKNKETSNSSHEKSPTQAFQLEEDFKYLKGAGWILRLFQSASTSSSSSSDQQNKSVTTTYYHILLSDGMSLILAENEKVILWKGSWFSLIDGLELGLKKSYKKDSAKSLDLKVRRRLGIVGEMIELF